MQFKHKIQWFNVEYSNFKNQYLDQFIINLPSYIFNLSVSSYTVWLSFSKERLARDGGCTDNTPKQNGFDYFATILSQARLFATVQEKLVILVWTYHAASAPWDTSP